MMRTLFYGGMRSLDELQDTAVVQEMRIAFDAADQDKDGVLNKREFVEAGKNNPQLKR
jgi:Ca2+-binding EF-hand superfamily protein